MLHSWPFDRSVCRVVGRQTQTSITCQPSHPEATAFALLTFSERQPCAQLGSAAKPSPISSDLFHLRAWEHPFNGTASTLTTMARRYLSPGEDAVNVTFHLLSDTPMNTSPSLPCRGKHYKANGGWRTGSSVKRLFVTFAMLSLHPKALECGWTQWLRLSKAGSVRQRPLSWC